MRQVEYEFRATLARLREAATREGCFEPKLGDAIDRGDMARDALAMLVAESYLAAVERRASDEREALSLMFLIDGALPGLQERNIANELESAAYQLRFLAKTGGAPYRSALRAVDRATACQD